MSVLQYGLFEASWKYANSKPREFGIPHKVVSFGRLESPAMQRGFLRSGSRQRGDYYDLDFVTWRRQPRLAGRAGGRVVAIDP